MSGSSTKAPLERSPIADGAPPPPHAPTCSPMTKPICESRYTSSSHLSRARCDAQVQVGTHMIAEPQPLTCARGKNTGSGGSGRQARASLGRATEPDARLAPTSLNLPQSKTCAGVAMEMTMGTRKERQKEERRWVLVLAPPAPFPLRVLGWSGTPSHRW